MPSTPSRPVRRPAPHLLATALAVLGLVAVAAAQPMAPPEPGSPAGGDPMQRIQALQAQIQQLNGRLGTIQEAAMAADAELAAQRDELIAMIDSSMAASGFPVEETQTEMNALLDELESEGTTEQRSGEIRQELQQRQGALQRAQQQALQAPTIMEERMAMNEDLVSAMVDQDPETEALIGRLQAAQQQYQAILQSVMQQQQGAPGTAAPGADGR